MSKEPTRDDLIRAINNLHRAVVVLTEIVEHHDRSKHEDGLRWIQRTLSEAFIETSEP
jgi:hypothetical protein